MKTTIARLTLVAVGAMPACFDPSVKKGVKAPIATISSLDGHSISLSQYEGKVVLVNFWATWCGPCRKELPQLESLQREFGGGFVVLAVNKEEPPETVRAFLREMRVGLIVVADTDGSLSSSYGVRVLPTNILIDSKGIVRATSTGYTGRKFNKLRQQISSLIAEQN